MYVCMYRLIDSFRLHMEPLASHSPLRDAATWLQRALETSSPSRSGCWSVNREELLREVKSADFWEDSISTRYERNGQKQLASEGLLCLIKQESFKSGPTPDEVFLALKSADDTFNHLPHIGAVNCIDCSPFHRYRINMTPSLGPIRSNNAFESIK